MTVLTLKWWTQKDKHNKQKKSIKFSDEFKSKNKRNLLNLKQVFLFDIHSDFSSICNWRGGAWPKTAKNLRMEDPNFLIY